MTTETWFTPMLSDGHFIRYIVGSEINISKNVGESIQYTDATKAAKEWPGLRIVQVAVSYAEVGK